MERKVKRGHADRGLFRPEGLEARLSHGRRSLAKQRREKAEQAFQKSLRDFFA